MQAIVETVFDAVYLVSVITIGILMIRGCKGSHQFKLFGLMAVVLGAETIAHKTDTISYEVLCGVSRRVPRVYLENGGIKAVEDWIL